jgi:hypothetical protein
VSARDTEAVWLMLAHDLRELQEVLMDELDRRTPG